MTDLLITLALVGPVMPFIALVTYDIMREREPEAEPEAEQLEDTWEWIPRR